MAAHADRRRPLDAPRRRPAGEDGPGDPRPRSGRHQRRLARSRGPEARGARRRHRAIREGPRDDSAARTHAASRRRDRRQDAVLVRRRAMPRAACPATTGPRSCWWAWRRTSACCRRRSSSSRKARKSTSSPTASARAAILDRDVALERLRQEGARIVTREMVVFEWLGEAATPLFREVSREFFKP